MSEPATVVLESVAPDREVPLNRYSEDDDTYYRAHFAHFRGIAGGYETVRAAYLLGHLAGIDGAAAQKTWEEAETALERAWEKGSQLDWGSVAPYAGAAYLRASSAGYQRQQLGSR